MKILMDFEESFDEVAEEGGEVSVEKEKEEGEEEEDEDEGEKEKVV